MKSLWVALTFVKGLGSKSIKSLYHTFPNLTLEDFESSKIEEIKKVIRNKKINESLSDYSLIEHYVKKADTNIKYHKENNIEVITIFDSEYPGLLKKIDNPPIALYCKGNIDLLQSQKTLAIVGTRNPTNTGEKMARRIADIFSNKGYVVISGLAKGIDTEAHIGTLEANGKTIAVIANSLDKVSPKENQQLAMDILNKDGLLVSEYPLNAKPFRAAFVQRDRIQSGLSLAICPVQTDIKGGTQHTIEFARNQGRVIFCPVPMENVPSTRGIKKLLEEGALSLNKGEDILVIEKAISQKSQQISSTTQLITERENSELRQLSLFD